MVQLTKEKPASQRRVDSIRAPSSHPRQDAASSMRPSRGRDTARRARVDRSEN